MLKKTSIAAAVTAATALLLTAGGCSATNAGKTEADKPVPAAAATLTAPAAKAKAVDYTAMTPKALAEYLIFESGSYDLDQPTQEGTNGRARLTQDEIQKTCSLMKGQELSDKDREKVMALAAASIKYPEGGIKLGNWKKGRELAWSGFGFRTAHKPDVHGSREPGGNCYNCHQMATDRTGGTIGPSLTGYGKNRGSSPDMLKYTYDVIYNANTYFACTSMPRMGANGVVNQQQIADIMAYLFDPESPVNK
ncbi:MAG: sulfur oxidation c-type cytochrome SoxX [Rhodocyclaceae bacterium]|jgi:sulfur-oxidizing protein SoxX|nr:sulfur oxidation c-type cytochrome SoxX [Rhodocyclaceae bacterium]